MRQTKPVRRRARTAIRNGQLHATRRHGFLVSLCRRLAALALACAVLGPTAPLARVADAGGATPPQGVGAASVFDAVTDTLAFFFGAARGGRNSGMAPSARTVRTVSPRRAATDEEREAKVRGLIVNLQGEVVMEPEELQLFSAIPVDSEGQAIQGLIAEWESSDGRIVAVTRAGEATAIRAGRVRLTARAGSKRAAVSVYVGQGGGQKFGRKKQVSAKGGQARESITSGSGFGFIKASAARPRLSADPARFDPAARAAAPPAAAVFVSRAPEDDPLPDDQTDSLYLPANDVGKPPGKTEPGASSAPAAVASGTETPGSANFSMSLPVVNLAGRGLGVSLALNYNSRVWHTSNGTLTYDVDSGWPAPGFRLGYGQMEDQGVYGLTLTDPNGTRHEMRRTGTTSSAEYDSTDGTFIHFQKRVGGGTATYTDGTRVEYGAAGNGLRSYPVKMVDENGNYILISYVDGVGPRISSIQDTLGRYVRFTYENGDLVSVTAPRLQGAAGEEITAIRLYYGTIDFTSGPSNLQSLFSDGVLPPKAPASVRVVRYVHYPATGMGYRYDYSPYGMIRQITQLREMQPAGFNLDPLASAANDGQWAASTLYDYPNSAASLTDAPRYRSRTDDWVGRTSAQPVFTFEEDQASGISRVISPDGSVSETKTTVSLSVSERWKNGLVEETTFKASRDAGAAVLARTRYEWEQGGPNLNPRQKKVWSTDETGETRAVTYDLYDAYNNVMVMSEHDFAAHPAVGAELRRTEIEYVTDSRYVARRLVRLPAQVRVVANGIVASRVDYGYDETATVRRGADEIKGHDQAFNPEAQPVRRCRPTPKCEPEDFDCGCSIVPQYDPATVYRGNVTSVKAYSDAANPAAGTTKTTTVVYDILGNTVELTANCCRKKTFTYTDAYKFAYPETQTRGEAAPQLSTSTVYDFNTGLVTSETDENGRVTTFAYDAETQRPARVERPAGGGSTEFFHEPQIRVGPDHTPRYSRTFTRTYFESGRAVESHRYFDGRGAMVRSFNSYTAAQGWVTTDFEYDAMGQMVRSSNPYYSAGDTAPINAAGLWTTSSVIDKLGRVTEVTLPDGTKVTSQFAGRVTTATDQAGRPRRQVSDALGRLAEMHEPDAAGNLGTVASPAQKTVYEYDALDNLTKVQQDGSYRGGARVTQERVFRYDSLSQLTHERQVEEAARLNDEGAAVATGGRWSRVTKYDAWGNVTDAYDARGVHTQITYDPLNRVDAVAYSDGTPAVDYTYDEARVDPQGQPYANRGQLTKVATAALTDGTPATVQEYDYDGLGKVVAHRQGVGADTYAIGYKYNWAGQLTEQTYPSGRVVKQSYDEAARPVTASNASGTQLYVSGLKYAAHGGLESVGLGNGANELLEYNSRLQVKTHTLTSRQSAATKSEEVVQRYSYKYGQADQATGVVDEAKNAGQIGKVESFIGGDGKLAAPAKQWEQRFSYDAVSRLARVSESRGDNGQLTWQSTYSYDRFGNRYQHQSENPQALGYTPVEAADVDRATNRLAAPTANTPGVEYDDAGNVLRDTKFRHKQFRYNANGRMTWAANLDKSGATTAVYDGIGQRVQTSYAGRQRVMVYDISGRVVAEYGAAEQDGGGLRYLFTDQQGSTRAVLNGAGGVVARRDYAPFGEEISGGVGQRANVPGYFGLDETRQKYAQTERDRETGLDHTLWRKYDSSAGRWTSPDPYLGSVSIGDPQSFNRYAYVGNDPVNFADPTGLLKEGDRCGSNGQVVKDQEGKLWCVPLSEFITATETLDPSISLTGGSIWNRVEEIGVITPGGSGVGTVDDGQQGPSMSGPPVAGPLPLTPAQRERMKRLQREAERRRIQALKQKIYDACFHQKMKEPMKGLEAIMNRNLAVYASTFGLVPGGIVPRMGATIPELVNWLYEVNEYERATLGPAREKAKAECKKEAAL